jgi:outer membrane receptor for ferrienterochelin and colicins
MIQKSNEKMWAKLCLISLLFILFTGFSGYSQSKCDWSTIDDASAKYKNGNFEEVIEMMQKCINSGFDDKQKVQAYRLIAKTQLELDNDSLAQNAIVSLLQIEPQFQPDYLTDPTRFIEVLQEIKEQNNAQLVTSVSKKAENIKEAPATVILLTSKQLKNRGYLDLEAVMHDLPGFDISRSNGNLYSHIYQRGYRSINTNRTLFLVDGVEENDLWSSNVYLSRQYPLGNIKNIEVVYGPASTMYGSNAFLGVVNVITKEPWEMIEPGKIFGANARLTYGSYNTKMADITLAARTKNNNISASVTGRVFLSDEHDLSDFPEHSYEPRELTDELTATYHANMDITDPVEVADFLSAYPSSGTYYAQNTNNEIILTDEGINQALAYDNEVYNNASFSDKTEAYYIEGKLKIYDFLIGGTIWNKAEGPGAQYNDQMFMGVDQGMSWRPVHHYFYVKYEKSISNNLIISNFLRYKVHDFDKDNNIVRYRRNYASGRYGLTDLLNGFVPTYDSLYLFQKSNQLREELKVIYQPLDIMDVVAGFEFRFSSIQGDYTFSNTNDVEQSGAPLTDIEGGNQFFSRDIGVYVQTGISFIDDLKLTLGMRFDRNVVRQDEGYGNVFNPRVTLVYAPKSFIVKAIYAEAFKDATNREKYSTAAGKRELTNPGLKPEKVKNYEFSIGKTFMESLTVSASGYYSQYGNIIQEVAVQLEDGSFTNQNQGKGKAEVFGVNAMADYKWNDLTCYANYTFTLPYSIDPVDSDGNPILDENGEPYDKLRISDIADHQVNIGANYSFKEILNINLRANIMSQRQTGQGTTVPTNSDKFDPYFILNGSVSYSPKKTGLTVQLSGFNLLNTEYFSPGLDEATGTLSSSLRQNGLNMYLSLYYEF